MEDLEIVGLYWARDQLAIAESQRKYGSLCGGIAMNILRNREDAEECVNDTWGRAWDNIPPQRPGSLGAYLGRIVRNLALNRWRKNHAEKRGGGNGELLLSELRECLPEEGEGVLCAEEQLSAVIGQWLTCLPQEDRIVFLRRYWYCDGVAEIAAGTGYSQSKVKSLLHRTRQGLKEHLRKEGYDL